jgi:hypothetical protein
MVCAKSADPDFGVVMPGTGVDHLAREFGGNVVGSIKGCGQERPGSGFRMCGVAAADSTSSTISARGSPAERGAPG